MARFIKEDAAWAAPQRQGSETSSLLLIQSCRSKLFCFLCCFLYPRTVCIIKNMGLYRNLAYFSFKKILILQQRLVRLSPECFIFLTQTQIHAAKVSSKQTFRCNDTHMKNWNLWIKSWAGNHHLGKCRWISSTNFFYCSSFHSQ